MAVFVLILFYFISQTPRGSSSDCCRFDCRESKQAGIGSQFCRAVGRDGGTPSRSAPLRVFFLFFFAAARGDGVRCSALRVRVEAPAQQDERPAGGDSLQGWSQPLLKKLVARYSQYSLSALLGYHWHRLNRELPMLLSLSLSVPRGKWRSAQRLSDEKSPCDRRRDGPLFVPRGALCFLSARCASPGRSVPAVFVAAQPVALLLSCTLPFPAA